MNATISHDFTPSADSILQITEDSKNTWKDWFNFRSFTLPEIIVLTIFNVLFFAFCFTLILYLERRRNLKQRILKQQILNNLRPQIYNLLNLIGKNMTEEEKISLVIDIITTELMKYNWQFDDSFEYQGFDQDLNINFEEYLVKLRVKKINERTSLIGSVENV